MTLKNAIVSNSNRKFLFFPQILQVSKEWVFLDKLLDVSELKRFDSILSSSVPVMSLYTTVNTTAFLIYFCLSHAYIYF